MSRSSPAVRRVAAVLNFFLEHPGRSFTLTDVIKALKFSRATTHSLMTGLVEVGYLFRVSDKSYILGPVLAAIGRSASTNYSLLQVAQPEMRALADEFDAICSAFFRDRDDVIVLERAAAVSHLGSSIPRGTRLPLRVPLGVVCFAWLPAQEAEDWFNRVDPTPTPQQRSQMVAMMEYAREMGFMCMVRARSGPQAESPDTLLLGHNSGYEVSILTNIEPNRRYHLGGVHAPVYGTDGRVEFTLGIVGTWVERSGMELIYMGRRLSEACQRISNFNKLPNASSSMLGYQTPSKQ